MMKQVSQRRIERRLNHVKYINQFVCCRAKCVSQKKVGTKYSISWINRLLSKFVKKNQNDIPQLVNLTKKL